MNPTNSEIAINMLLIIGAFALVGLAGWCIVKFKDGTLEEHGYAKRRGTADDRREIPLLSDQPITEELDADPEQGMLEVRMLDGRTIKVPNKPSAQPVRCKVCGRILSGKVAIEHQLGRVCRAKVKADQAAGGADGDSTGATVQRGVAAADVSATDPRPAGDFLAPPGAPDRGGELGGGQPHDARGALSPEHQPQPDPRLVHPAANRGHVPVGAGGVSPTPQAGPGNGSDGAAASGPGLDTAGRSETTTMNGATP